MERGEAKTICLITPGHICSNPRMVKEAMTISAAGFRVHIIFTQYVAELITFDRQILLENPTWTYNVLNWTGVGLVSKSIKFLTGFYQKTAEIFRPNGLSSLNRNYSWQFKKAISTSADLYIAHNLAALPVAVNAAKKKNVTCGFDAEDFHRNEITDDADSQDVKFKSAIEDEFIPKLNYLTAASPLISAQYRKLYNLPTTSILNTFPQTDSQISINQQKPLKLFWFSQTIGEGRGLETIVEALKLIHFEYEFHLIGKINSVYKAKLLQQAGSPIMRNRIIFHGTVGVQSIFTLAAKCDIGLASEIRRPLNRDICLTNKIFTYIQSGLLVLASDTTAQLLFMKNYPEAGHIYRNINELSELITYYHENRAALNATKTASYELGQNKLNWEIESKKFLALIKDHIEK